MNARYANAAAFRQALEERLRTIAAEREMPLEGLRLKVSIERLLARLFADPGAPWLLKGGYSMELRFRPRARSTRDVDLAVPGPRGREALAARLAETHESLVMASRRDMGDHFGFVVAPARDEVAGAPGGGGVFAVTASIAGRVFARFHIDVGFGDAELKETEALEGEDLLAFAGVPPATARAIRRELQFAEKLHAYTRPWGDRVNTRSRDLVDLVLLVERGELERSLLLQALQGTFERHGKHPVPRELAPPPVEWASEFPLMAAQVGLRSTELMQCFGVLAEYWGNIR